MANQVLERFHRALIEEIQTQRPEYLTQPFTVAEIYQNLVPYGSHRDRIGVEMNGDYEDALVRLLAGEGGYLILDSKPALRNLRAELDTPNPNTGVYREFAAVDVRLNQAYLDLSHEALDQLPDLYEQLEAEDPVAMTDLAPAEGNASAEEMGVVPPGVDIFADARGPAAVSADLDVHAAAAAVGGGDDAEAASGAGAAGGNGAAPDEGAAFEAGGLESDSHESEAHEPDEADDEAQDSDPADADDVAAEASTRRTPLEPEFVEEEPEPAEVPQRRGSMPGESCLWCRADLPERETLNFCPFCGTDASLVPCPECGDEVEPGWRFCVSCGTEVDA